MRASTIRIHPKVTAPQFGVMPSFFEQHIEGKELPVLDYTSGFYTVEAAGDTFTVHHSDIDRNHHEQ